MNCASSRAATNSTASLAACSISSNKPSSCTINRFCIAQDLAAAQVISALLHRNAVDQIDRASYHRFEGLFDVQEAGHVGVRARLEFNQEVGVAAPVVEIRRAGGGPEDLKAPDMEASAHVG